MKYPKTLALLLFVCVFHFGNAQTTKQLQFEFTALNGFEGEVELEAQFYYENQYKLKLQVKQVEILKYRTSIGEFSADELQSYGLEFPFVCQECSLRFKTEVTLQETESQQSLRIPVELKNSISVLNDVVLNLPFAPDDRYQANWLATGALEGLNQVELEGQELNTARETVKHYNRDQLDARLLSELNEELGGLNTKEEKLALLYKNRNGFYNKSLVDDRIAEVNREVYASELVSRERPIADNPLVADKGSQTLKTVAEEPQANPAVAVVEEEMPKPDESPKEAAEKEKVEEASLSTLIAEEPEKSEADKNSLAAITKDSDVSLQNVIEETEEEPKKKKGRGMKKSAKLSQLDDFDFSPDLTKYKRSSLHTIMLKNPGAEQVAVIEKTFLDRPLPTKFNEHSIDLHFLTAERKARKQEKFIAEQLRNQGVAKALVARWFGRDEQGYFNMGLVEERGHYNASSFDLNVAKQSERGLALLADAGEQLIGNTFVIVNDYKYTNKEEVAKKTGFFSNLVSIAASAAGADEVATIADATTVATGIAGKGYVVKVTSYLFRLKWNDKVANRFYEELWVDANNPDEEKRRAFDRTDLFELEYLGYETDFSATQSTIFTSKSDAELIQRATIKATDQTIAKLQKKFKIFRTITPLISTEPLAAKIGVKEGLGKGDKFEVLEQVLADNGTVELKRVGVIKVDKRKIWDNEYRADYESGDSGRAFTEFSGSSNKFYEGMLIRQIN